MRPCEDQAGAWLACRRSASAQPETGKRQKPVPRLPVPSQAMPATGSQQSSEIRSLRASHPPQGPLFSV